MASSRAVFASEEFTDEQILSQLESVEHQMLVGDHGPPSPSTSNPPPKACTISFAKAIRRRCLEEEGDASAAVGAINALDMGLFDSAALVSLRSIAESFLSRSTSKARQTPPAATTTGGDAYIGRKIGPYTLRRFLAKGSGGLVYAASNGEGTEEEPKYVCKLLFDAHQQLHEYSIAQKLRDAPHCIQYLDCIKTTTEAQAETWFVLPLVSANAKGYSDLRQYIEGGDGELSVEAARKIALQLVEGLHGIASRGIILRDVKPDNVLVDGNTGNAFWCDFGLAVDSSALHSAEEDLVQYWYDVCKLVPRPKWRARRPPERAYQFAAPVSAFDTYMLGIVLCSLACGVDFPHIEQDEMRRRVEHKHLHGASSSVALPKDYLTSFELGDAVRAAPEAYLREFQRTFGEEGGFAPAMFELTKRMLDRDPGARPTPAHTLEALLQHA